jgi:hypothetical protein
VITGPASDGPIKAGRRIASSASFEWPTAIWKVCCRPGEQIGADAGAALPSPIGEEPAVLEEGLVAPGLDVQRRQPGQAGVKGADEGIPRVSGFARKVLVLACGPSLDAYEAVVGLNVGRCWPRLLGCAGDRRG